MFYEENRGENREFVFVKKREGNGGVYKEGKSGEISVIKQKGWVPCSFVITCFTEIPLLPTSFYRQHYRSFCLLITTPTPCMLEHHWYSSSICQFCLSYIYRKYSLMLLLFKFDTISNYWWSSCNVIVVIRLK